MSTEQQYRVIGKSGPGVDWRSLLGDTMIQFTHVYTGNNVPDRPRRLSDLMPYRSEWDAGRYDILEAISPPQAEVATCGAVNGLWPPCELPSGHRDMHYSTFVDGSGGHGAWGVDAGVEVKQAGATKAPECIRSACTAPPVAGGELCAAHAGQVEAAKAKCCAWKNGGSACGLPSTGGRLCQKHEAELRASDAAPNPPPPETRLERWRREHKGYSHGTADPRIHDANVAAMMMGIDGPRSPYVPTPKLPAWTPRDPDGDIPDAWDRGGARLGR